MSVHTSNHSAVRRTPGDLPTFTDLPSRPRYRMPVGPFLLELQRVSDEEIARHNAQRTDPTEKPFGTTSETRIHLLDRTRADKVSQLRQWIQHPDQRIVAEVINQYSPYIRIASLQQELYDRAIRDADSGGYAWTLLLEMIVLHDLWPSPAPQFGRSHDTRTTESPESYAERLAPWLREESDPAAIERLLAFRTEPVRHAIACHAAALSDITLCRLLENSKAGYALVKSPRLTEHQRTVIAQYALDTANTIDNDRMRSQMHLFVVRLAQSDKGLPLAVRERLKMEIRTDTGSREAATEILVNDRSLSIIELNTLLETATSKKSLVDIVLHPAATPEVWRTVWQHPHIDCDYLLEGILSAGCSGPALLEVFYDAYANSDHAQHHPEYVVPFAQHPSASFRLWRTIAQRTPTPELYVYLCQDKDALKDILLTGLMEAHGNEYVLWNLYTHADEVRRQALLPKLARQDPVGVIRDIWEKVHLITPGVLAALFTAEDPHIRIQVRNLMARRRLVTPCEQVTELQTSVSTASRVTSDGEHRDTGRDIAGNVPQTVCASPPRTRSTSPSLRC